MFYCDTLALSAASVCTSLSGKYYVSGPHFLLCAPFYHLKAKCVLSHNCKQPGFSQPRRSACHLCNSSGITLLQSELICFENPPLLRIVQWNALLQSLQYDDTRQSLAELLTQNLPGGGADKSSAGMFGVWCQWCPPHIVTVVPSTYGASGTHNIVTVVSSTYGGSTTTDNSSAGSQLGGRWMPTWFYAPPSMLPPLHLHQHWHRCLCIIETWCRGGISQRMTLPPSSLPTAGPSSSSIST